MLEQAKKAERAFALRIGSTEQSFRDVETEKLQDFYRLYVSELEALKAGDHTVAAEKSTERDQVAQEIYVQCRGRVDSHMTLGHMKRILHEVADAIHAPKPQREARKTRGH